MSINHAEVRQVEALLLPHIEETSFIKEAGGMIAASRLISRCRQKLVDAINNGTMMEEAVTEIEELTLADGEYDDDEDNEKKPFADVLNQIDAMQKTPRGKWIAVIGQSALEDGSFDAKDHSPLAPRGLLQQRQFLLQAIRDLFIDFPEKEEEAC